MKRTIKEEIEFRLERSKTNRSKRLDYILIRDNEIYAFASDYRTAIEYSNTSGYLNFKKVKPNDWKNFFDEDLFNKLEHEFKIDYISERAYHLLWKNIKENFPDDILGKKGLKIYLKYCITLLSTNNCPSYITENKEEIFNIFEKVKNI